MDYFPTFGKTSFNFSLLHQNGSDWFIGDSKVRNVSEIVSSEILYFEPIVFSIKVFDES